MYVIEKINPLKDSRWDTFVHEHKFGWICHLSSWQEVLEKSFSNLKGNYFVLVNTNNNQIIAGLPVFFVKSWLIGNRLVSQPFTTLFDPLISTSNELSLLLEGAFDFFREKKYQYLELRTLDSFNLIKDERFISNNYYKYHYLNLDCPLNEIWSHFHRTCIKQRITRAENSNLKLIILDNNEKLRTFYNLYLQTRKKIGLPPQPYKFIKSLWDMFYNKKMLDILFASYNGKVIACLMLLKFNQRVSVEFACSDPNYWNMSPNHYLFWEAIKLAVSEKYKVFDFGRTSPDNKGLMDFKKRWGTTMVDIHHFYYFIDKNINNNKTIEKSERASYKIINKIIMKLPDNLVELIGNFFYSHLS